MALAGNRVGCRLDAGENVEIEEAVVERRDQRIRHGMREPGEMVVGARGIDDDEIMAVLDGGERVDEGGEFNRFVVVKTLRASARDAKMQGHPQLGAALAGPE